MRSDFSLKNRKYRLLDHGAYLYHPTSHVHRTNIVLLHNNIIVYINWCIGLTRSNHYKNYLKATGRSCCVHLTDCGE